VRIAEPVSGASRPNQIAAGQTRRPALAEVTPRRIRSGSFTDTTGHCRRRPPRGHHGSTAMGTPLRRRPRHAHHDLVPGSLIVELDDGSGTLSVIEVAVELEDGSPTVSVDSIRGGASSFRWIPSLHRRRVDRRPRRRERPILRRLHRPARHRRNTMCRQTLRRL